jgi:hypothetical protein
VNYLPFAAIAFLAIALPAHAEIFRCTADGAITYQEIPCPASATGGATLIPDAYPEINRIERDRLFQREAALDARLLKRAEIDAAERIARDDRIAREQEAQALREAIAQREAASGAPVFMLARPFRPPRAFPAHRRPPSGI